MSRGMITSIDTVVLVSIKFRINVHEYGRGGK